MQIFQPLITPAILAPLFFTTTFVASLATPDLIALKPYTYNFNPPNKASPPDCTASPTVIVDLPYEFWIEVVFLEPPLLIDGSPLGYRPGNPLRILGGINSPSGAFYDGVFIAETFLPTGSFDVRALFKLEKNFLFNSDTDAKLWLGTNDDEPESDFFAFNFVGDPRAFPDFLAFGAVEVCNEKNETELQLRAQRSVFNPTGVWVFFSFLFFLIFPPLEYIEKPEGKHESHPRQNKRSRGNGDSDGSLVAFADVFRKGFKLSNSPADYVQFEADILGKIFTPANLNGTYHTYLPYLRYIRATSSSTHPKNFPLSRPCHLSTVKRRK